MTTSISGPLGIIHLERGVPPGAAAPTPPRGSLMHPDTLGVPLLIETAKGAWVHNVVRGEPGLERSYVEAAQRLVARGAVAITSTCGFTIRYQKAVAQAVKVPVSMSSLLLLPLLLRQFPASTAIAVLTYDSTQMKEELLGLDDPADRARIVIGGIEGGKYWHDEQKQPAPPTDVAAIENDVTTCVTRLREAHPQIAAILLECAGFPLAAPAIRRATRLPVYDITTQNWIMLASIGSATNPTRAVAEAQT